MGINEGWRFSFPGPQDQHQEQHSWVPIKEELSEVLEFSD